MGHLGGLYPALFFAIILAGEEPIDHEDETRDEVVERLTRQVAAVFFDLLAHLGLDIPENMVLTPRA